MSEVRELIIESKTHGKFIVLYDAEDEDKVAAHTWHVMSNSHGAFYVTTNVPHPDGGWYIRANGKRERRRDALLLHQLIAGTPKGMETDHINGNRLDNRKSNLRVCTHAENQRNKGSQRNNASGFKGVYYKKRHKNMINEYSKPWVAQISYFSRPMHLGVYKTPEEAAEAYDRKACELWDIVNLERMLNFPERYEEYMSDVEKK